MSYSEEVCEYSYESFANTGCGSGSSGSSGSSGKVSSRSCPGDQIYFCGQKAGLDRYCGCLSNDGGKADWYLKTNDIACGDGNSYVCNALIGKDGIPKYRCGCQFDYKEDAGENIISFPK